jgi:GrpB-like predicted nucleotidyltransferase (UPF0157 family)
MMIVNHDPGWATMFVTEKARLQQALGASALRIEHHRSTALPGRSSIGPRSGRTRAMHLVEAGSAEDARTLAFRDYLRTHAMWRMNTRG